MKKNQYIKRLHQLIKFYKPNLIILRGYRNSDNRISKRVIKTVAAFEKQACELDLPVYKYAREDIREVFKQFEGNSQYNISKTICSWYPELKRRMPDLRKNTKSEHYQMGVFDAFALMLTHYYLE